MGSGILRSRDGQHPRFVAVLIAGGERTRQFFLLSRATLKIAYQCAIASGGPNPLRELPLFPCSLLVQQPQVIVSR